MGSKHERRLARLGAPYVLSAALLVSCKAGPQSEAASVAALPSSHERAPVRVTHGVAAGDITSIRAVIWSRADRHSCMHLTLEQPGGRRLHQHAWVTAGRDFTGKIPVFGLTADTSYTYTVGFSESDRVEPDAAHTVTGAFRTAPDASADRDVSFGWSGDLGGLNVCRDRSEGYPVFRTINTSEATKLDFFIGLGDMVYADMPCGPQGFYGNAQIAGTVGPATTVREYWAHWKYNREDPGLRTLLASTGYYGVWDDHEVANDFSPGDDWHATPPYVLGADLLPLGRQALLDYNPIFENPEAPHRLYSKYRWGKHLELVVLDTRSYRSDDVANDSDETPKSLLGAEQRRWFEDAVAASDATWKVVVSSVPIALPTGRGPLARDGWANFDGHGGNERELRDILRTFRDRGVKGLVWITTDVHFATGFVYHPFSETPDFRVYEFSAGPLGAMLLAHHAVDETFHPERLLFYGPEEQPKTWDVAKRYMNWGRIAVSKDGPLTVSIRDGVGGEAAKVTLTDR